jgi:acyl-CoA dehydrogenase
MSASSLDLVRALLSGGEGPAIASAAHLRMHLASLACDDTVDRAALGGARSDALGWAFACGYEAALCRLGPMKSDGHLVALAATEEGGGHPRAIKTALARAGDGAAWRLSGDKAFVTLGTEADVLLVVASVGQDAQGRNRLRVVRVPSSRDGVSFEPGPALPFAPEIGHARLRLRAVRVADDELLPGDGYDDVLKPFRTLEDTHVLAAAVGWAIGVGVPSGWERAWMERAVATLASLRAIGQAEPSSPSTHLALAGALDLARTLLSSAAWDKAPEPTRARWERDRPLLDVARPVRAARLEAAWRAMAVTGT